MAIDDFKSYAGSEYDDYLKRLSRIAKENSRIVRVNVGLLKGAIREIESQANTHGETIFTRMVLEALNLAIEGE